MPTRTLTAQFFMYKILVSELQAYCEILEERYMQVSKSQKNLKEKVIAWNLGKRFIQPAREARGPEEPARWER